MDSIGSGEIFLITIVALLALDPKTVGRWFAKFRHLQRRLFDVRENFEQELQSCVADEPPRRDNSHARLRQWASDRVASMGQTEIDDAPLKLLNRLRIWDTYKDATDVAAFWPLRGEFPLEPVLRGILEDGKVLWLPWVRYGAGLMDFAPVRDLDADLVSGRWNLREPRSEFRSSCLPKGGLMLVPGRVFDLHGTRLGRGGGFYDRWLAMRSDVVTVGVCWDVQVHPSRLLAAEHDIPMDHLTSEKRWIDFGSFRLAPPQKQEYA